MHVVIVLEMKQTWFTQRPLAKSCYLCFEIETFLMHFIFKSSTNKQGVPEKWGRVFVATVEEL